MTNAEIILELIEVRKRLEGGWCQGAFRRFTWYGDEYCLVGAIASSSSIMDLRPISIALGNVLTNHAAQNRTQYQDDLACWNDKPYRTQEEVLDLVDRAIASVMKVESAEVAETCEELVEA